MKIFAKMLLRKKTIVSIAALFLSASVFALDFGVQIQPSYNIASEKSFKGGFEINGGLDIAPITLRGRDTITFKGQGSYTSFKVPGIDNQTLFDGSFGVGYSYRINDRIGVTPELYAGIWSYTGDEENKIDVVSGILFGGKLSFDYYATPALKLSAFAGYKSYASFINSVQFGIGLRYSLSRGLFPKNMISLIDEDTDPLYPVFYSRYENNSFGYVTFVNNEPNDIQDVSVSVFINAYMQNPNTVITIPNIASGESFNVDLYAFLNENILDLIQPKVSDMEVTVTYYSLGKKLTSTYNLQVTAVSRNSMTWEDDRRAAAFVSGKDASAQRFAKQIKSIVQKELKSNVPENIQYAAAIFGALKAFGINYVVDPSSAFTDNVGTDGIDFLQFPYQTLVYHGGDCDDLSILNCSLLEAIGIDTAFITIPGHIFIAFDSGLTVESDPSKANNDHYIAVDGKYWVPLEITLSQDTFSLAWTYGAREWKKAGDEAMLIPLKDAWVEYLPISIPESDSSIDVPSRDVILKNFKEAKYY